MEIKIDPKRHCENQSNPASTIQNKREKGKYFWPFEFKRTKRSKQITKGNLFGFSNYQEKNKKKKPKKEEERKKKQTKKQIKENVFGFSNFERQKLQPETKSRR